MSACLAPRPEQAGCRWVPGLFLILVAGALSPLDYVVAGMARRGLGCEAIRLYLRLGCDAFDDALARLGLARPHERPLRKPHPQAWGLIEVWKLIALWIAGVHPATIGVLLGRTEGSVRSKAYRMGLPRRDRKLLIRDLAIAARVGVAAASGAALAQLAAPVSAPLARTSAPSSRDVRPSAGRREPARAAGAAGGTNVVALRGTDETPAAPQTRAATAAARKTLQRPAGQRELPVHGIVARGSDLIGSSGRQTDEIRLPDVRQDVGSREIRLGQPGSVEPRRRVGKARWDYERLYEVSLRAFDKQHPRRIAEEMGVSYGAVQSILWRIRAPRGYRQTAFGEEFDRRRAEERMRASGYEFVPSKKLPGASERKCDEWFWRHRTEEKLMKWSPLIAKRAAHALRGSIVQ